jgi:hypothetical protein
MPQHIHATQQLLVNLPSMLQKLQLPSATIHWQQPIDITTSSALNISDTHTEFQYLNAPNQLNCINASIQQPCVD